MHTAITAKVHKERPEGTYFIVLAPGQSLTDTVKPFAVGGALTGELRIDDGRRLSAEQRRKTYAMLADLSDWSGHEPEDLKEIMKYHYIGRTGGEYFSLSDCSMATAREFITCLIDFAFEYGVPLRETAINRADDIDAALYSALKHRRCIVCGKEGITHHMAGIGAGGSQTVANGGNLKMCLCRPHHYEAHNIGQKTFDEKYHVYGIDFN